MTAINIPSELINRFKDNRVALFVGAGCSRSAGLPGWKELLKKMEEKFSKEGLLPTTDKGQLNNWFKDNKDFPRIAAYFKNNFPELYRGFMQETFDPPGVDNKFIPPEYSRILKHFPINRIITTNFDKLLEDALPPAWGSLTWQDTDELPRYVRNQKPLVFHIHGRADRYGTLVHTRDEYEELNSPKGTEARNFLQRIFEQYTILIMGYRLGDPVIAWVCNKIKNEWSLKPDWYALSHEVDEANARQEMSERNLHLLPYFLDPTLKDSKAHETGLLQWFQELAGHLNIQDLKPKEIITNIEFPHKGWIEINDTFLHGLPTVTQEVRKRYYHGEPPNWALVKSGYTAHRIATDDALQYLEGEGLRAVLVKGAGGEGKSTILMQVALGLLQTGFKVFYANDPDCDPFKILKTNKGPIALIINQADQIRNLKGLLRYAANSNNPTRLVLSARINEWQQAYGKADALDDASRYLKEVTIGRLTNKEAALIAANLIESGAVADLNITALAERILSDSNGFLLAAMLTATHGEPLSAILADVVKHVAEWVDGEEILTALGLVVALESRKNPKGERFFCSFRLFQEAIGKSQMESKRLCYRLVGEISLRPRGGYRIETRHPVIAETLYPILFKGEAPYLDELDIHKKLLTAAGRFSREYSMPGERKLLSVLPLIYAKKRQFDVARPLFQISTDADPKNAHTWQAWALMERALGNVTEAETIVNNGLKHCPSSDELLTCHETLQDKNYHIYRIKKMVHQAFVWV